jgi:glutamine synthetase
MVGVFVRTGRDAYLHFGTTLCIPYGFISYTGETLDYKTPLLRCALMVMDEAATSISKIFLIKMYTATGMEQEYFLVDRALANSRLIL